MKTSVLALTLFCAACNSVPAKVETVTVDKQVVMPCVTTIPDTPAPPQLAADADIEQRAAAAKLRILQLQQHILELRAILLACEEKS